MRGRGVASEDADVDATPLHAELFSVEQMARHGQALAGLHVLGNGRLIDPLLRRLDDNERVLIATCRVLTTATASRLRIAPAGEWMLDNLYLIEEQIRIARRHLPRDYSRELPRLANGPSKGLPRVYDLALEVIAHGDGRVDSELLSGFLAAYQTVTALTLGELWAIPIMLRLALIENLRRVAARTSAARLQLNQAQAWADQMMAIAEKDPKSLVLVIADMARSNPPMTSPFVAELVRCLQGHGPALALPLTWVAQRLAESSETIDRLVSTENQQRAGDQVSISNTITSLRFLGAEDWRTFVETHSVVERILLTDPADCYAAMDFATRDLYRQVVDRLAKRSDLSESEVARSAIRLAENAGNGANHDAPIRHIGFYLVDAGIDQLEDAIEARQTLLARVGRHVGRARVPLYLGSIALMTLIFSAGLLALADNGRPMGWLLVLLGLIALLATSQLASAVSNWSATAMIMPKRLPRMDFSAGLPQSLRTLVVVPSMLGNSEGVESLLEALEVRFLGNRDAVVHFALLTDSKDADVETAPEDSALLEQARVGIETLNAKYPGMGCDRFFLFHRPRVWNDAEQCWMGRERKRGKLADLNAALRGQGWQAFSCVTGDVDTLTAVQYVITLDTDTQLPRDAARELVGTMAHPLNRPRYDEGRQRVRAGYGILQPRMAASLSATSRSHYGALFGSEPGIDPYTRSASDVYQDLFGEGSFIGKGIYDVDAFETTLKGRFPDNRILSHDLLEGCHARSGLISDVHLYEAYPTRYAADVGRRARWIRGDWQILQWLMPWVPRADHGFQRNLLPSLSRWKIADNLRRSVVPAALVALLVFGWWWVPQTAAWTLAVLGILLLPTALISVVAAVRRPEDIPWRQHLAAVLMVARHSFAQAGFTIACLPYEAFFSLDAIARSLWRMLISGRGLLEWRVSGGPDDDHLPDVRTTYRVMWAGPAVSVIAASGIVLFQPWAGFAAAPVLLLWLLGPALAWWVSQPLRRADPHLSDEQTLFLRRTARNSWMFFEHFVTAEDHWLPPDNFQEEPGPVIAHRTSPTNIGLALLANLAARDFGYITAGTLLDRTADTFATMNQLERYQGHFYNWYDTQSLQPLPPRYVSSVDSGNLAGHLLTLRAALEALPDEPVVEPRLLEGLADTLAMLVQAAPESLQDDVAWLDALLAPTGRAWPTTLSGIWDRLNPLSKAAIDLEDRLDGAVPEATRATLAALLRQTRAALAELDRFAPWLGLPEPPGPLQGFLDLDAIYTLRALTASSVELVARVDARINLCSPADYDAWVWLHDLRGAIVTAGQRANARIDRCGLLAGQAGAFASMNYAFLYDHTRHLLAIGYNVDDFRCDASVYDLLASESRLCCFVAIAQGQLPQEAWFALGRLLTTAAGSRVLLSWTGSMFEYLMPLLVMPSYDGTLLDQTYRAAVSRQIAYGKQRAMPWGVSESGYGSLDASQNYRYQAFGVPGLGLKPGLAEDAVVAPYASALALLIAPEAACANLQRLADDGLEGRYGFYEAIDYTPTRLLASQSSVVVRSFMAHHQGMSLLALGSLLLGPRMQQRFASDPLCQATLLLLQERSPKTPIVHTHVGQLARQSVLDEVAAVPLCLPIGAHTPTPEVQLLSNGRYQVMMTNAGGGYSRWKDLAISRWREDVTRDDWGTFVYLRDVDSGAVWSATHQPTRAPATAYEAMFSEGRAEYRRRDHDIETYTEIVVSPEDDIELRRIRLTNGSRMPRTIEITSYAEVVLASQASDMTQPGFGNLFVQTELVESQRAILCTRRPRAPEEATPWMFHLMAANSTILDTVSCETDRMRFIGRGRDLVAPAAMDAAGPLSGTVGSVLDPIVSIRARIVLAPEQSATVDLVSGAADDRAACMALVGKYQDRHFADRVRDIAATHSGVTLRQINASEVDAQLYRRLAGSVIYANARLRADAGLLAQNRRGQSGLWGYAISGDLPIVLLKISSSEHIELARQLIQCHAYWRLKGLMVDLVVWNEEHVGYRQSLQDAIMGLIATGTEASAVDRPGGIFVRQAEQISHEDRILLQAVARVIVIDGHGSLADQIERRPFVAKRGDRLVPARWSRATTPMRRRVVADAARDRLILGNDLGGFSASGREYVITSRAEHRTPAPWVNVLANPVFGTVMSESGPAYTWHENAHEYRLTPWSNDAVGASAGEAFYLRDEDSGAYWSPTALPSPDGLGYRCRHGFGYTVYEHDAQGLRSQLWVYVDRHAAVKFSVLKVRNTSGRRRRLSATAYVEWVLGDLRSKSAMHLVTEIDPASGALFARNAYNTDFAGRIAFIDADAPGRTLTGDRTAFIGRNRGLAQPDAMSRRRLSGRLGAGMDPCGAIQIPFELADGASHEVVFRLGAATDIDQARALALRLRQPGSARTALDAVRQYWRATLGTVQVHTPDPAINVMANGWLLYQTLACRVWARSGYYQSGGAYGFRDQLQDGMALVHAAPDVVRAHLLRAAEHQYPEGDVQHWWHPPVGRGVRTRCSDDYLWLPASVCRYVRSTGDRAVLDEDLHFLEGRPLEAEEESYYELPGRSEASATLYAHCVRAIEHGLRLGEHGLPLMGSGDWNDGMNLVGIKGQGESVWLAFFLYDVLRNFAALAADYGDAAFSERCITQARQLRVQIHHHAWDGEWYQRAWFDDGTPLGSKTNVECTIDSIAQSWSVLSGAGESERSRRAMDAVDVRLVRRGSESGDGLIQLLDPPFDTTPMNPGYIKGYVPGVRENGGQYTHAAVWAAMAFARLGDSRRAWELMAIINPVNHAVSAAGVAIYKTEPYALAADVYALAPHTGRGGWTWYTGSAGWAYRLIVESLLGLRRTADHLQIVPCIPDEWRSYALDYSYGATVYHIEVTQTLIAAGASTQRLLLDGVEQGAAGVALVDDSQAHTVEVSLRTVGADGIDISGGRSPQLLLCHDRPTATQAEADDHYLDEPAA
ncbi:GH36-type glycosyl hydrolase domain-containing protein [Salinisphaera sp. RV14]|uniref:GH36-type glycosyl hydrolase domain-containing protein n=1 Tax=Salinisphaera sp. RV14 TaxID=3454140 RepID=UPI003F8436B7